MDLMQAMGETVSLKMYQVRRWTQQRRLIECDVTERNSLLTNNYSLVYILHFVEVVNLKK